MRLEVRNAHFAHDLIMVITGHLVKRQGCWSLRPCHIACVFQRGLDKHVDTRGLDALRSWLDGFWDEALAAFREAAEAERKP